MILYPNKDVLAYLTESEIEQLTISPADVSVEVAQKKLEDLDLSDGLLRACSRYGIEYLGECTQDILSIPGFGIRAVTELHQLIKQESLQKELILV